jgi:hypothetical protein
MDMTLSIFGNSSADGRTFFLARGARNRLKRPKEEQGNREDTYPKIDSVMSTFTLMYRWCRLVLEYPLHAGGTRSPASHRLPGPGQQPGASVADYLSPYLFAWLASFGLAGSQKAQRATEPLTDNTSAFLKRLNVVPSTHSWAALRA